jgi:hypothetical protein
MKYKELKNGQFFSQMDDPKRNHLMKIPGGWMSFRPIVIIEETEAHAEMKVCYQFVDGQMNIEGLLPRAGWMLF